MNLTDIPVPLLGLGWTLAIGLPLMLSIFKIEHEYHVRKAAKRRKMNARTTASAGVPDTAGLDLHREGGPTETVYPTPTADDLHVPWGSHESGGDAPVADQSSTDPDVALIQGFQRALEELNQPRDVTPTMPKAPRGYHWRIGRWLITNPYAGPGLQMVHWSWTFGRHEALDDPNDLDEIIRAAHVILQDHQKEREIKRALRGR